MDTQEIYNRNIQLMEDIVSKHTFSYSLAQIMEMSSVHINFNEWTFRLFGIRREKLAEHESPKFKQVTLYHYSSKMVNKAHEQEEIYNIREDFIKFNLCFNQTKAIKEIISLEDKINNASEWAKVSLLKTLRKNR